MRATDLDNFHVSVLDTLTEHIAVIDEDGAIEWVNRSWQSFAEENGGLPDKTWQDTNYLDVCSNSAATGDADGAQALEGLRALLRGDLTRFYFEYPCHSPVEQRWFMMRIRSFEWDGCRRFVVAHQNITERKLAELRVEELAIQDGLTGIANRRHFDTFLDDEWRRAQRLGHDISLILFDIDHFKPFNDHYGHPAGDECLRRVSRCLSTFCRRPGDLVARYGGEEFAAILGNTGLDAACELAELIRLAIHGLGIPHELSHPDLCLTVSAGVASVGPVSKDAAGPNDLINAADKALYAAKRGGRNRIVSARPHRELTPALHANRS